MNQEFIIMDASVIRMNAKHVLEEGLFLLDAEKDEWCKNYQDAKKFASPSDAINIINGIKANLSKLPRMFTAQQNGNNINITEIKYQ
jgi:hypothetical protein